MIDWYSLVVIVLHVQEIIDHGLIGKFMQNGGYRIGRSIQYEEGSSIIVVPSSRLSTSKRIYIDEVYNQFKE